jgi:hypothetical protein
MELVLVLRVLWRRRIAVLVAAIAAVLLAFGAGGSPTPPVGVAWARMIVDTGKSQLADADPYGADSLVWRTQMLAEDLTGDAARTAIARSAGLDPAQLRIIEPRLLAPEAETALPLRATEAAAIVTAPYLITVEYDDTLPVLTLEARGPKPAVARALAEGATARLASEGVPVGSKLLQPFDVQRVTPIVMRNKPGKSPALKMAAVGIVAFLCFAFAIAVAPDPRRVWRAAARPRAA